MCVCVCVCNIFKWILQRFSVFYAAPPLSHMFTFLFIHLLCTGVCIFSLHSNHLTISVFIFSVYWCGMVCSCTVAIRWRWTVKLVGCRASSFDYFMHSKWRKWCFLFAIFCYGYYLTIGCSFLSKQNKSEMSHVIVSVSKSQYGSCYFFVRKSPQIVFLFRFACSVALPALQVQRRLYTPLINFDTLWRGDLIFRRIYIAS